VEDRIEQFILQGQQALRQSEMVLSKEHPSILISMNNLATRLRNQGKYEQAEDAEITPTR
jgi:hypothetical protein